MGKMSGSFHQEGRGDDSSRISPSSQHPSLPGSLDVLRIAICLRKGGAGDGILAIGFLPSLLQIHLFPPVAPQNKAVADPQPLLLPTHATDWLFLDPIHSPTGRDQGTRKASRTSPQVPALEEFGGVHTRCRSQDLPAERSSPCLKR